MDQLDDRVFRIMFKMRRLSFIELLGKIWHLLLRNETQARLFSLLAIRRISRLSFSNLSSRRRVYRIVAVYLASDMKSSPRLPLLSPCLALCFLLLTSRSNNYYIAPASHTMPRTRIPPAPF